MRKKLLLAFIFATCLLPSTAQDVLWSVDFRTIFDNREGESKYTYDRTFFLTQLSPEIGLSLLDGEHSVFGGVSWTQPIGCEWEGYRVSPTLYYMYKKDGVKGFLGMFPRTRLYRELPDYIWNDSTYYVQHNIRGAGIVLEGHHGYFQAIVDWRGMQSKTQREAFNIIAMGEWQKSPESPFTVGGVLMMNHLACRENPPADESVVDNFLLNPYVGVNFKTWLPSLDSLKVDVGLLGAMTRDRSLNNKWKVPVGFWMDARFRWKWLAAREEFYAGGRLFPYYNVYGNLLDQGEPYFAAKIYSRTELQGYIFDKPFLKLRASLDFHVADGDLMFYQRIILNVNFDGNFTKKTNSLKHQSIYY